MSEEDDAWALGWMADHPRIEECASGRVTIDGITHRAVYEVPARVHWAVGWWTLCKSHRLEVREGRIAIAGDLRRRRCDFSSASVDCLCCIPAGG